MNVRRVALLPNGQAFALPMPIPPVLQPVPSSSALIDTYRLNVGQATVELLPGLPTKVLTYNGQFVGPTIQATVGRPVRVIATNNFTEPIAVHLHGGHTPSDSDGYPMDVVQPGQSRVYNYPNNQQGTMLWYHDHAMGLEAVHVYSGLHGMYVLRDHSEDSLGLPSGAYDVPIMIRDADLDTDGNLVWQPVNINTILVNGVVQPYFQVAARKYRLRIVNAAVERIFRFDLGGGEFIQIGSDGGLYPAPVSRTELVLGSAERADVVVDFSRYPVGSQVMLSDTTGPALRFDVVRTAPDTSQVPAVLRALPALPPATVTRQISMKFDFDSGMSPPPGTINGAAFDPNVINFQVKRGSTEIWEVTNADPIALNIDHSFHVHMTQFRVLDRQGSPMLPDDDGLKDTINVPPGSTVRIQATFRDYLGKYVFHCHYLEHSVLGMMGQIEVIA
ncbi:MAG TPA: multicopper oxidase family protein [Pseudonocardiaceae bacterium]|nr:multicopper oxidase family protein [Pseudonocardiaceae bacterium]